MNETEWMSNGQPKDLNATPNKHHSSYYLISNTFCSLVSRNVIFGLRRKCWALKVTVCTVYLISKYQGNVAFANNFVTSCNKAPGVPVKPKASDLERLKDPLKEDEVWVVDGGLLCHVLNLHLGLLLAALLFLPLLLLLLLLLPLLLLVLLLSVPALAVLLQASEKELSKSVQKK